MTKKQPGARSVPPARPEVRPDPMRMVDTGLMTVIEQSNIPTRMLRAGEVLYRQGDPADAFYLIRSGRLKEMINDFDVNEVGPRFLLGIDQFGVDANGAITLCNEHRETVRAVEASVVTAFTAEELTSMFLDPKPESRSVGPKLVQWFGRRFAAAKHAISLIRKQLKEESAKLEATALELTKARALTAEANGKISALEERVATLSLQGVELAKLRPELEKTRRTLTDETTLSSQSRRLMEEQRERADSVTAELAVLQTELESMGERLTEALGARDSLAAALQQTGRDLVEHKEAHEEAARSNAQLVEFRDSLQKRIRELERLLAAEQTLRETANARTDKVEKRFRDQQAQYQADEDERQKVIVDFHIQSAYASRLERTLEEETRTSTRLRSERDAAEKQRDDLQKELDVLNGRAVVVTVVDAEIDDAPTNPHRRSAYQPRNSSTEAINLEELRRGAEQEVLHQKTLRPPPMLRPAEDEDPALILHIEDDPTLLGERPVGLDAVAVPAPNPFNEPTGRIGVEDIIEVVEPPKRP